MHIQFMIEDRSSAVLIDLLMEKLQGKFPAFTWNIKSFRGIGGFTKKNTIKETKTGKLLNDLATYLSAFDKQLQGVAAAIFIIVDNDTRETADFRRELEQVAHNKHVSIDHVFCIAVEEVEAWLLGDRDAVEQAYPSAKASILNTYIQDSICGTWELLADAVYQGGSRKLKKDCPTYMEIGERKAAWAKNIGTYMQLNKNKSPSFQYFMGELTKRLRSV